MSQALVLDQNQIWTSRRQYEVSYPDEGSSNCFAVEEQSFWFAHRNQVIAQALGRFPMPPGHSTFADIGGGNGFQVKYLSEQWPALRFVLVEPSYTGCLNARRRGCEHVYNLAFEEFPFQQFAVGGAGLFDVLEHIAEDVGFLSRLGAHLPQGARVYLTVPAFNSLWSHTDEYGGHVRRYTLASLRQVAQSAGLQWVHGSYFFSYLFPLTWASRRLPYLLNPRLNEAELLARESQQHQPGGLVGKALNLMGRSELAWLAKRRLPLGASCVAVLQVKK